MWLNAPALVAGLELDQKLGFWFKDGTCGDVGSVGMSSNRDDRFLLLHECWNAISSRLPCARVVLDGGDCTGLAFFGSGCLFVRRVLFRDSVERGFVESCSDGRENGKAATVDLSDRMALAHRGAQRRPQRSGHKQGGRVRFDKRIRASRCVMRIAVSRWRVTSRPPTELPATRLPEHNRKRHVQGTRRHRKCIRARRRGSRRHPVRGCAKCYQRRSLRFILLRE